MSKAIEYNFIDHDERGYRLFNEYGHWDSFLRLCPWCGVNLSEKKKTCNKGKNNPMYGIKGKNHPSWKDGIKKDGNGYMITYSPNHPYKRRWNDYVGTHRLVLEHYYTILFDYPVFLDPKTYDVHHIDGDKENNSYWNLQLLTKSQHTTIHNLIDMSDRVCILCGSNKTYIMKHNKRPHWMKCKDGYSCMKCYLNEYNKGQV